MVQALRLTSFSHGAGCACKLGPRDLRRVLDLLGPAAKPEDVLVSEETGDDAAVYRLADGTGLVLTLDFFTPLVDDPGDWGRIAAANALSDVYAMGGTPRLALNVAGWPVDELPLELLADVLAGAREVAVRAGATVVGGHTITTERVRSNRGRGVRALAALGAPPCASRHRRRRDETQSGMAARGHRLGRPHPAGTDRPGRCADERRAPGGFGPEPVRGAVHRDRRGGVGAAGVDRSGRTGPGITTPTGSICTCNRRLRLATSGDDGA